MGKLDRSGDVRSRTMERGRRRGTAVQPSAYKDIPGFDRGSLRVPTLKLKQTWTVNARSFARDVAARLTGLPKGDRVYSVISTEFFRSASDTKRRNASGDAKADYLSSDEWFSVTLSRNELSYYMRIFKRNLRESVE